jgi:hypothetical protein
MPRIVEDFCFGESCSRKFPARACRPVDILASESDTSAVVARVALGDTVRVRTRNLHVLEPGRIIIRRRHPGLG